MPAVCQCIIVSETFLDIPETLRIIIISAIFNTKSVKAINGTYYTYQYPPRSDNLLGFSSC